MTKNIDYKCEYWLYDQYWNKGRTLKQVGEMCGVSLVAISNWMDFFNITKRTISESKIGERHQFWGKHFSLEHRKNLGINKRGENHWNWKGGKTSYYQKQARRIWEEYWREKVPGGYYVHHGDRNRANNNIYNLALLTLSYHAIVHDRGRKKC